jgi:hypothetical protein
MLAGLMMAPAVVHAASAEAFRQQNGLLSYIPPAWFLEGCFIAREKNPNYVFGPVQDFVAALGGKTTWLIEDLELEHLEHAASEGKSLEYSVFLEAVTSDNMRTPRHGSMPDGHFTAARLQVITEKPRGSSNTPCARALKLKPNCAF